MTSYQPKSVAVSTEDTSATHNNISLIDRMKKVTVRAGSVHEYKVALVNTLSSMEITVMPNTKTDSIVFMPVDHSIASSSCRMSSSGQPSLQSGPEHWSRKTIPPSMSDAL